MINGINHITFAVSDLEKSIIFYSELLGLKLIHFLDPDGHKLELHYNSIEDRLKWAKENDWPSFVINVRASQS